MSTQIPTAVLKAEQAADEAIARDSKTFDPSLMGAEEGVAMPQFQTAQLQNGQGAERQDSVMTGQSESLIPETARATDQQGSRIQTPEERIALLTQQLDTEKQRFSSLLGRIESQHKPVTEENRILRKKVQELEQELSDRGTDMTSTVQALRKKLPNDIPVDDNELEVIMRVARQTVREELDKSIPEHTQAIRQEFAQDREKVELSRFVAQIGSKFQGFIDLDANKDPRWMQFLSSKISGAGGKLTYGMAARQALADLDLQGMSEIIEEFSRVSGVQFNGGKTDPRVESQVRPKMTAASSRGASQGSNLVFKASQIAQFNKDYASGAIRQHLTNEQIEELKRDIDLAVEEDRVVNG